MAREKITSLSNRVRQKRGRQRYVFKSSWVCFFMGLVDGLGGLVVTLMTLGRGLSTTKAVLNAPDRILVIRLDHIGDVLFARPALEALRNIYPNAHITLMISSICAELMRLDPAIDDLLIWDAPWFNRQGQGVVRKHYRKLIKAIGQMNVDLSLDLRGDLRHHIMLTLAGVRCRLGHTITGGRFLLHQPIQLRPDVHEVERNLDVVRVLSNQTTPINYPPLALTQDELIQQRRQWRSSQNRIVIHPAAGDNQKCWSRAYFIDLCQQLAKQDCEIILIGTMGEKHIIHEIMETLQDNQQIRDLCGQTTIRELAALITTADFFIGHDSGPAHIAITQSVPTIMLWSATNQPIEWGPWGEQTKAVVIERTQQTSSINSILTMIKNNNLEMTGK